MKRERSNFPVNLMAHVLEVSRSGYYDWLHRKPSERKLHDERMKPLVRAVHEFSRKTYGSLRMQSELADNGVILGRDQISRLRRELGLKCIQKKKFKATTNSNHDLPVVPNLLEQDFSVMEPGTVYGTDITYIPTDEGWLYLAGVKDFGSRELIGHSMGERMTKELVHEALEKAIRYREPKPGCIHHSDRGCQYCALSYQAAVKAAGMRASMSRRGNCYDNAPTESFCGSLKQELIYNRRFATRAEAKAAVQEYIEVFYNRIRRHSVLGNIAPARYAEAYLSNQKKAS
jgi:transposase InsO family protein